MPSIRLRFPASVLILVSISCLPAASQASLFAAVASSAPATPQIAFTFDDLPAHGPLPPGETRLEIASKIIAALRNAHLPPIYGFVNGVRIQEQPVDESVLEAWRAAGNPLGNHGWSHLNLNQHTPEEFDADIVRDEPVLSRWMKDRDWHWFRFPFLAEGNTQQKQADVRAFLLQHGYKIAGVTMSFGDYQWNEPYARCAAKHDAKAIEELKSTYLKAADDSITYYRSLSRTLYGHDIPYVLLMHIGALDAEMLPRLLDLYQSRGFQFVTLTQAENDPFYRIDTNLNIPPGPDSLEGVMAERHLPLPSHPRFAPPENACR